MRPAVLLAAALGLSAAACATPVPVAVACLPLRAYSPAEQKALALELAALPAGSVIERAIADYGAMRDADRAACKAGKP